MRTQQSYSRVPRNMIMATILDYPHPLIKMSISCYNKANFTIYRLSVF